MIGSSSMMRTRAAMPERSRSRAAASSAAARSGGTPTAAAASASVELLERGQQEQHARLAPDLRRLILRPLAGKPADRAVKCDPRVAHAAAGAIGRGEADFSASATSASPSPCDPVSARA
jgi:hypothetical protein